MPQPLQQLGLRNATTPPKKAGLYGLPATNSRPTAGVSLLSLLCCCCFELLLKQLPQRAPTIALRAGVTAAADGALLLPGPDVPAA